MRDHTQKEGEDEYVAKASIDDTANVQEYLEDCQMQAMCKYYATCYNKRNPPKKVEFVDAFVIQRFQKPGQPIMACEPYMKGNYVKYSNNFGYVSPDDRNTPQAFSHFTWWFSNGQYMVVDIQGVGDKYTDPQVHSLDGLRFGRGNCGKEGMAQFHATHKCNSICVGLGLISQDKQGDFVGTEFQGGRAGYETPRERAERLPVKVDKEKPQVKPKAQPQKERGITLNYQNIPNLTPEEMKVLDMHLQKEHIEHIAVVFKKYDTKQDGTIALADVPKVWADLRHPMPHATLMMLMEEDKKTNRKIRITFDTFIRHWTGKYEIGPAYAKSGMQDRPPECQVM
jgi:hypothetical protein